VALTDPTGQQLTITVETMKRDSSQCGFSSPVEHNTTEQTATFQLDSSFAHITQLYVFFSNFSTIDVNQAFIYKGIIALNNGMLTLQLPIRVLHTLSTINCTKGAYEAPPASTPFSLPYQDDFDQYTIFSEAAFFADQLVQRSALSIFHYW
jgi:hypothetical protein